MYTGIPLNNVCDYAAGSQQSQDSDGAVFDWHKVHRTFSWKQQRFSAKLTEHIINKRNTEDAVPGETEELDEPTFASDDVEQVDSPFE
ncbi:hypothetical protein RB195_003834 [Necator americanus]|uniref:Uncharacterized protein n=1 Tax=Necator americanus TaxID=51031 RepID=A0ABR1DQG8_NECAM